MIALNLSKTSKFTHVPGIEDLISQAISIPGNFESKGNETKLSKSIPKYKTKTGRPLMLGERDIMVQKCIRALNNRGAVIQEQVPSPQLLHY